MVGKRYFNYSRLPTENNRSIRLALFVDKYWVATNKGSAYLEGNYLRGFVQVFLYGDSW